MGPYLSQPITEKKIQTKKFGKIISTSCQMQGWRKQMQDSQFIIELIHESIYLFGIFDGHGGPQVSHYVSKMLPKQLLNQPTFKLKQYGKALTNTFKRMDDLLMSNKGQAELRRIQKQLLIPPTSDKETISFRTGCTANVVLLTKQKIYVANIGDSRSVLCRKSIAIALSEDHKPDNPNQKDRILKAGGTISNGRVNGGLNLSRSFGDFAFKSVPKKNYSEQPIVCVPQIIQIQRKGEDEFILMGCDGIWEKYVSSNQQMINLIKKLQKKYPQSREQLFNDLYTQLLGKSAEQEIGCDNMTSILIEFI